jgi:hypothetical protein
MVGGLVGERTTRDLIVFGSTVTDFDLQLEDLLSEGVSGAFRRHLLQRRVVLS